MTIDPRNRRLIANRYQIVDMVGSGAMGQVYQAEDNLLGGVTVAIKFLSQALLNRKMKERFEREATISALLGEKSIHIVRVRDYGVDEKDIPFYVMEFLQGENLSDVIKFHPLVLKRFVNITRQICLGLECAHQGIQFKGELCPIIHRDIKPSNILVIQDQTVGELVKILDFGIAKLIQSGEAQTQAFMGTLAYCSPEQMEGKELDRRSDIYSLGVMMYEMLTSEMPLLPDNPSFGAWYEAHHFVKPKPFNPKLNIPSVIEKLILKCLAKSPSERPQNIEEILRTFELLESTPKPEKQTNSDSSVTEFDSGATQVRGIPSVEDICRLTTWPKDKPQQKIVFPRSMRTPEGSFASLWVMLDQQDVQNRKSSIRYNQFLFLTTPHPMVLWITVLYNREQGPRWLRCYLDLKTQTGQQISRTLSESGCYWILFFALEKPQRCQHVMTATIAPNQCKLLKEWANTSQVLQGGQAQASKRMLNQEFEQLKTKILTKLESRSSDYPSDVSEW